VGKIAEKAVCGSVLLTAWHCILSAELTKNALLQTAFIGDFSHWANDHWFDPHSYTGTLS